MTQSGYAVKTENRFEDYTTLKRHLSAYPHLIELKREIPQTTTDAVAALEEVSGETIAAMAASKVLNVWQKTDQAGTDKDATGKVTWATVLGAKTDATFALDHTNTTSHAALVSAVTTARFIESFELDDINCADEVLLGNVAGDEIFAVIKVGQHQCLKGGFIAAPSRRSFIGKLHVELSLVTALVTLVCTFTPVGQSVSTTKTFTLKTEPKTWEPAIEVEPGTQVTWTIEDDNAAHPVAYVEITYIEAWKS